MLQQFKEIVEWNKVCGNTEYNRHLEASMLSEEFAELIIALKNKDKREAVDWLLDVLWVGIWTLYKLWVTPQDMFMAFNEIKESNYSKLIQENWEWTALRDATGKIIKPEHYRAPDLSFIEN